MFTIGGGDVGFEIDFSSLWPNRLGIGYTLGVEAGMSFNGIQGDSEKSVSVYSAATLECITSRFPASLQE